GNARNLPPCEFAVLPPRLDFGAVTPRTTSSLAMSIKNVGQDACFFTNVALTQNTAPEFRLSSSVRSSFILDPGETSDVIVRFTPTSTGTFMGNLEFYVSDPKDPYRSYPIFGRAVTGCLTIQPSDLDFGTVHVGCAAPIRSAVITNQCTAPVTLHSIVKGAGNSTEFTITQQPLPGRVLNPGDSALVQITYRPVDDGFDALPIYVDDGTDRRLISVSGRGVVNPRQTDRFEQADRAKVDVLFVIDNSGSMMEEQDAIGRNFSSFMKFAMAQGIDYHIGVTTTGIDPSPGGWSSCPGGVEGGEAGRLFPVDNTSPRVITPTTPNAQSVFAKNVKVGVCHWLEQGMEAAYRGLSAPLVNNADDPRTPISNDGNGGFLRPDAKLAIIYVSDEEDQSPQTVDFYATHLKGLKSNPALVSVSAIVGPADLGTCPTSSSSGMRYMDLAQRTGGIVDSICTPDWASSLEKLGQSAFGPSTVFPLSQRPGDPSQMRVRVNGADVTGWRYDSQSNAVVFEQNRAPSSGSRIEVSYPLGCP
ncbi:MAG: choice-of-anchor D domain-containing protein, partial [Myxococcales bacterium]